MSVTYLLRHGRTRLSASHIVNGDPRTAVPLDEVGIAQCRRVACASWTTSIAACVVSQFARWPRGHLAAASHAATPCNACYTASPSVCPLPGRASSSAMAS